ncbi:MAG TPA: hypothetical protein VL527_19760 [Dongiaceae bacterium]|nr:hypothetical protein [Dongiaceae bacterium]
MSAKPKLRRREFWLLLGACVLILVLVPVVRHYQLRATARAYVAQLRAQGEKLDLAEVLPPVVAPDAEASAVLLEAAALLATNRNVLYRNPPQALQMVAPGRAQIGWQQPAVVDGPVSNSWAEVEAALAQDDAVLPLLRQLPPRPAFDFNLPYDQGIDKIRLPHLVASRKIAQRLSAAVLVELHRGDAATAATDVRAMLALVQGLAHDRMFITELVRMANTHLAVGASWELLQAPNVSDSELAALQQDWAALEFIRPGENALLMERAEWRRQLDKWRDSSIALREDLGYSPLTWDELLSAEDLQANLRRIKYRMDLLRWRYWWSYADELHALQSEQVVLGTLRQARTNESMFALAEQQDKQLEALGNAATNSGAGIGPGRFDLRHLLSAPVQVQELFFGKVMQAETSRRMVVTAIALKRYQLKNGQFPEKLAELTPDVLPIAPIDPMSGQPFHYRREGADGFLLYSVGKDGVDDGGDASNGSSSKSMYWLKGRDWVWPQPVR